MYTLHFKNVVKILVAYTYTILGIGEIVNAFKLSFHRDFRWFGNKNKISLVKSTSADTI